MAREGSWIAFVLGISRTILSTRPARRSFILYVTVALLAMVALGNWPMEDWLAESWIRFTFWWLGCFFLGIFLFLLGVYDFLAVIRETRSDQDQ